MKMSEHGRIKATERCPEYVKDQKKFLQFAMKQKSRASSEEQKALYQKLRRKWDIDGLVISENYIDEETKQPKRKPEIKLKMYEREAIEEVSDAEWARIQSIIIPGFVAGPPYGEIPYRMTMGNCLFLKLQIDMSRNEEDLGKAFKQIIKASKQQCMAKKKAAREIIYNPWQIYDQKQAGLSLLAITRKLHGNNYPRGARTPAYNEKLGAPYKAVWRAYKQAEKMIKTVEEDAHRRETELGL